MLTTALVWLACSAAVLAVMVFGRTRRLHHRLQGADFDWKAVLLALIIGALPAFVFDQVNHRPVEVPENIANEPVLPTTVR